MRLPPHSPTDLSWVKQATRPDPSIPSTTQPTFPLLEADTVGTARGVVRTYLPNYTYIGVHVRQAKAGTHALQVVPR